MNLNDKSGSRDIAQHVRSMEGQGSGPPVFDEGGHIRQDIRFPVLAAHVWFSETDRPWDGSGDPCQRRGLDHRQESEGLTMVIKRPIDTAPKESTMLKLLVDYRGTGTRLRLIRIEDEDGKTGDVFYIDRVGNIYIKEEDHG